MPDTPRAAWTAEEQERLMQALAKAQPAIEQAVASVLELGRAAGAFARTIESIKIPRMPVAGIPVTANKSHPKTDA